jgi:hypothetical protein
VVTAGLQAGRPNDASVLLQISMEPIIGHGLSAACPTPGAADAHAYSGPAVCGGCRPRSGQVIVTTRRGQSSRSRSSKLRALCFWTIRIKRNLVR